MDESQTPPTHLGSCRYLTLCEGFWICPSFNSPSLSPSRAQLVVREQLRVRPCQISSSSGLWGGDAALLLSHAAAETPTPGEAHLLEHLRDVVLNDDGDAAQHHRVAHSDAPSPPMSTRSQTEECRAHPLLVFAGREGLARHKVPRPVRVRLKGG
jgi:hypothetical protein